MTMLDWKKQEKHETEAVSKDLTQEGIPKYAKQARSKPRDYYPSQWLNEHFYCQTLCQLSWQ